MPRPRSTPEAVVLATKPLKDPGRDRNMEADLVQFTSRVASLQVAADRFGITRPTIQRKMRLMASVMLIGLRWRMLFAFARVEQAYAASQASCERCLWSVKQSFDEFMISILVGEKDVPPDGYVRLEHRNVVRAKLMQVNVEHSALYRIGTSFVSLHAHLPTINRAIEGSTGRCTKQSLADQTECPEYGRHYFPRRNRVSTKDDHGSNHLSDYSRFEADPSEHLIEDVCDSHKLHKFAEMIFKCFPAEVAGLLYLTLALNYTGAFSRFIEGILFWLKHKLVVYPGDANGVGQDASQYRETVWDTYCHACDDRLSGSQAAARQQAMLARRRLLTGDLKVWKEVPHVCGGWPGCCRNPDHTYEQMRDEYVEVLNAPKKWAENRWLGIENALNFAGELMCTHGLLIVGIHYAFFRCRTIPQLEAALEAFFNDLDRPFDSSDGVEFKDVEPEQQDFERQSTYRGNVQQWLATRPHQRLWMVKRLLSVQQECQKGVLSSAGPNWRNQQIAKALRGEPRSYQPLDAYNGVLVNPMLLQLGYYLVAAEPWECLPVAHQTVEAAGQCLARHFSQHLRRLSTPAEAAQDVSREGHEHLGPRS